MATQNTDLKEAKKDAIMTPDMYRSMFLRQFTSQCSQSYDKMMAMGFMYTIQKPLRKIYPNDDDYYAALDRHTEFFNITPHVLPFVAGLTVSMEEQAAADKNFDTSSINAMKVGLMGPLSGIGDSFYWGTFRVVAAGIGIGIASTGNPLGPIVYALIYSVINFATRIVAAHLGYDLGTKFLQQSEENNLMSRMTHAAGVLGMTVIGAMIAAQVSLSTALTFDVGGSEMSCRICSIRSSPVCCPCWQRSLALPSIKRVSRPFGLLLASSRSASSERAWECSQRRNVDCYARAFDN